MNNYAPTINDPYKLNANFNGQNTPIEGRLYAHDNGLDYNPVLDQIVISARVTNEVYIIDHSTTSDEAATGSGGRYGHGGDFLYRFGNPSMYGAPGEQMLFMQHNAQWIPAGYPGAGDLTVMNNGNNRPGNDPRYTVAYEWTPPVNPDGSYSLMANGAFGPTAPSWTWTNTPPSMSYNSDGGGIQRLYNGNTMISFDTQGLAFEVDTAGKIVWQFQNGNAGSKGVTQNSDVILYQGDDLPPDYNLPGGYTTTVYNCPFYPLNYFTFTNQTMVGTSTIEQYRDYFELYNPTSSAVNLAGLYLTDDQTNPTKFKIPTGVWIAAGGYVVFYADGETTSTQASGRHTNFTLSASGGQIYLYDIDALTIIDTVTYGAQAANVAYGRSTESSPTFTNLTLPSPGGPNESLVPTAILLSNHTVGDKLVSGTNVGTLTTNDANLFESFTYSLVSGDGSTDNAAFTISGDKLLTAAVFDASVKNAYSVRIRSTDSIGLNVEQVFTINITHTNQPPVIVNTGLVTPALPNTNVTINTNVTDEQGLTGVNLTYVNKSQTTNSTPFIETFGVNQPTGSWTGTADNTWSLLADTPPFKLAPSANFQTSSSAAGMQFPASKAASASMTTVNSINVAGVSASISFWVKTQALTAADSWTLQVDATGTGNNFTTALTESNVIHAFAQYTYNLTSTQLVPNLLMRFVFTGGGTGDTGLIQLDQIVVSLNSIVAATTVPMFDDGTHGNGSAGDGVYGATIPGQALGSNMSYYITASNNVGLVTTAPSNAPAGQYTYTVQNNEAPTDIAISSVSIAERAIIGTTVGSLTTTDPDAGNSFTYSFVIGTGSTDNNQFTLVGNTLKSAAVFDAATKDNYSVRIRSTDQGGLFFDKVFAITVADVNDPPVGVNDQLGSMVVDDNTRTISFASLLANDSPGPINEASQALTILSVGSAVGGTVSISGSNVLFTPTPDYNGSASFVYTLQDNGMTNGTLDPKTSSATVIFMITEVNDDPSGVNDLLANIAEDSGTRTIPFAALLGNDSTRPANEVGQQLTITNVGSAVGGTVSISGTNVLFNPMANYNGPASFVYTLQDNGTTNGQPDPKASTATANFVVTAVNDAPIVQASSVTTNEDNSKSFAASDFSFTDVEEDGITSITIGSLSLTSGDTLRFNGTDVVAPLTINAASLANLIYTPAANANGANRSSFNFKVNDADAGTVAATMTINVTAVNDTPTGTNDLLGSIAEDSGNYTISFATLLGNDSKGPADESNQALTVTGVSSPVGGTVAINGTNVIFTPTANYNGPASFVYTLSDNGLTAGNADPRTASASASFTITEVNDAPTAGNDSAASLTGSTLTIAIATLLANDSRGPANESSQTLSLTAVGSVVGGTVAIVGSNVVFSVNPGFGGAGSFQYTVTDNGTTAGANDFKSAIGTVSFTVLNANTAPAIDLNGSTVVGNDYANTFTSLGGTINLINAATATVIDPDNSGLVSITATLSAAPNGASESLSVDTTGTSVTANYSPATLKLVLSGTTSVAQYQQVLRTLSYTNLSLAPTTTARTVTVTAFDGTVNSNVATSTVNFAIVANPPVVDLDGPVTTGFSYSATFNKPNGAVAIAGSQATVTGARNLQSMTLQMMLPTTNDGTAEALSANTSGTNIAASLTTTGLTRTLTLTGSDTPAHYQQVLRSIVYDNAATSPTPGSRLINVTASDGAYVSTTRMSTISVVATNMIPVVTTSSGSASYQRGTLTGALIDPALNIVDDSTNMSSATVRIATPGYLVNQDMLVYGGAGGLLQKWEAATGTLTLSGIAAKSLYVTALESVRFKTTSTVLGSRTIQFQVTDSTNAVNAAQTSTSVSRTVNVVGPQQFAGPTTTTTVAAPQIHTADLKPFVIEAVARWTATGITPAQAAILKSVQFEVRDLGKLLGLGGGHSIIIDDNAAGQGWYIDPTPVNDVEFTTKVTNVERLATRGSAAAKGVDLLSVVIHELGHTIGLDDLNPLQQPHQVMTDELGLGTRRTPQPIAVDALMWALSDDHSSSSNQSLLQHTNPRDAALTHWSR